MSDPLHLELVQATPLDQHVLEGAADAWLRQNIACVLIVEEIVKR